MRKIINLTLLFCLVFTLAQQAESQTKKRPIKTDEPKNLTAEQIAKKYLPSVVLIVCDDGAGNYSQGSGFFVREGVILTNHHVIEAMKRGKAKIALDSNKAKEWWIEKVLYTDEKNDLALLSVTETDKVKTPFLNLSETGKVNIGETIYVLSNPKGLAGTISQGIVSSEIRKTKDTELLQIDAPISSGSSGGAVLNARGEVIGIATASLSSGQNLNFAVTSSQIKSTINDYFDNWKDNKLYVFRSEGELSNSWLKGQINIGLGQGGGMGSGKSKIEEMPKNNAKATFEETTDWLTNKLQIISQIEKGSLSEPYAEVISGFKKISFKNLKFADCVMTYQLTWEFFSDDGKVQKITSFYDTRMNLKYLSEVKTVGYNSADVQLSFRGNMVTVTRYNLLYSKSETGIYNAESFPLFGDKESADRITLAFNRLKEICSENTKEPF